MKIILYYPFHLHLIALLNFSMKEQLGSISQKVSDLAHWIKFEMLVSIKRLKADSTETGLSQKSNP